MISDDTRHSIVALYQQGMKIRQICRTLGISRNTVRKVVQGRHEGHNQSTTAFDEHLPLIKETYLKCRGNVVRVQEMLADRGISIGYSTLTRLAREHALRQPQKHRAGAYTFHPGGEMQHDTSPHKLVLGEKRVTAQCADLVLAYSRRLFIKYYPRFTRFEAQIFLADAFAFINGACERIIIDNTSVIVAHGSGPDAEIAPEMAAFGRIFGTRFVPHRIGHADRKARIERPFHYVEHNFLVGRGFTDYSDLNEQALVWLNEVANKKPKRSLGMSPDEAYIMEKPYMKPLPPYVPPIYQTLHRVVDVEAYVHLDTNRYSVPERLIGKKVEVQKHADRVIVVFNHAQVASHPRVIDKRNTRVTDPSHHRPLLKHRAHSGPCAGEKALVGECETLDRYVDELKKRSHGRGMVRLRKLLQLKRTHPRGAFLWAITRALQYGLYDLGRLEKMILDHLATDFFRLPKEDD
jgi:transposase